MVTTLVRLLSDGEELVIEEGRSFSRGYEASFARRHQAMTELRSAGADADTPPLTALDVEPAGSMTDEGGAGAGRLASLSVGPASP